MFFHKELELMRKCAYVSTKDAPIWFFSILSTSTSICFPDMLACGTSGQREVFSSISPIAGRLEKSPSGLQGHRKPEEPIRMPNSMAWYSPIFSANHDRLRQVNTCRLAHSLVMKPFPQLHAALQVRRRIFPSSCCRGDRKNTSL